MFLLSQLMEAVHADADLADLRHSHQITKAVNMTISVAMTTGTTTARIEMITAVISSAMLTGTLPTLPVTIVTPARTCRRPQKEARRAWAARASGSGR